MKIAVALRTCDNVQSHWGTKRYFDVEKRVLLMTCIGSLFQTIKCTKGHEIQLSIHDDNSAENTLKYIDSLAEIYGIKYELVHTERLGNFKSQYEWAKKQDTDFVYCVEDDYLHHPQMFNYFVDMYDYLHSLVNQPGIDYAFYPWNNPQRYQTFEYIYPVMVFKHNRRYWRSELQSTHTFFMSKFAFDRHDDTMKFQAYNWPKEEAWDFRTITMIWREQQTRLVVPLDSLAYHVCDQEIPEAKELWERNYYDPWKDSSIHNTKE